MKTLSIFLLGLGLSFINLDASAQSDWVLVSKKDGIQFLSQTKVSRLNKSDVSTVLKVLNDNEYDVVVRYVPSSICGEMENMDKEEVIRLDKKGGTSLHTLPPCATGSSNLKIVKLLVERKD